MYHCFTFFFSPIPLIHAMILIVAPQRPYPKDPTVMSGVNQDKTVVTLYLYVSIGDGEECKYCEQCRCSGVREGIIVVVVIVILEESL